MPTTLPHDLIPVAKLLEKDEPKVLVVVGAGVSVGATAASRASWLGLLKHGVAHLVETEVFTERRGKELSASLDAAFSPFDLKTALQHAELVEQNLNTPDAAAFARWLAAAFEDLKVLAGRSDTLDALRDLQQAGALLLTTNYDNLLSEATGLPPVTWEEHAEFFQVIRRQQPGILYVHGHWRRPSSVVLGKSSYDRIARDQDFQDLFKGLWFDRSWLYVGCGDGLDDPNLGRLLEWGKRWNKDAPSDYFLAKADKAIALANRPDKPANLVCVGYPDHSDLPNVLQSLTPAARCWPFIPVDADFALFRSPASPLSIPFPSRREYLDGSVPALTADGEIRRRLEEHGWAFVLDVASVGKTTLTLRMATAPEQRDHPTFYLDLATVDADDAEAEARMALRRLSRPTSLLILDNAHHQPELARHLWDQWRERPRGSSLLLVATRMQRPVTVAPAQDLAFFEHHATNPAVELRPTAGDLGAIVKHLYKRVGGPQAIALPVPPSSALQSWHSDYGGALGAFCLAVLGRLAEFQRSHWDLPLEAASDWVREKWLKPLDAENRVNVLCLSVFAAQELELQIQDEALPQPGKVDQLLWLGLVAKTERGRFGQYHRFNLREPGWGGLILAAQVPPADEEKILFDTAARHPTAAITLSARLRRERLFERLTRLWAYLAIVPHNLLRLISERPLIYVPRLAEAAKDGQQPLLGDQFWEVIEREPDKLAEHAWETQLHFVGPFLDTAKRHQRNTAPLWEAIERAPDKLAERAWETQLHFVASFLDTAKRHQRDTGPLWEAIERAPDKLAERAWETPLGHLGSFLDTAKRHQRNTAPLWEAIERAPDKLAERAWETPLGDLGSFLDTAKRHQRNTAPLWEAIERAPDKLAERAWETPLGYLGSFLDTAKRHQRNTAPLWEAIERAPDKLAECAWETPLGHLGSFLDTAKRHQRNTAPLWEAIERAPDKLAECAWETPLDHLGSFLDTAKRHQRNTAPLWEAIERAPDKLAECAWETPLDHLGSFLDTAKRHQRDTAPLWESIERAPDKLAERAWETPLGHLGSFLDTAKRHQRNTAPLWEAIERAPDKLAERAWETPLGDLGSFLDTAKRHQRDTAPLWEAIERAPDKLAERAWETQLHFVASFLDTAKRHQRNTAPLWEAIERAPDKLAERAWETQLGDLGSFLDTAKRHGRDGEPLLQALASRPEKLSELAKQSEVGNLAGFCHFAPDTLVKIALADFQPTHWDAIPVSETLVGGTWVAGRCGDVGREDLKLALIGTLLRRANPRDFPPQGMALANVAWLLKNTPAAAITFRPAFLDALCTRRWLRRLFTNSGCGPLATGLRMLVLHQPLQICRRFQNPSLGIRVQGELARFAEVDQQEQCQMIELLGCATLFGFSARSRWFDNVPLSAAGTLPVDTLPHEVHANKVDQWQFQLWLGLRAVTEITRKPLAVPSAAIVRTLDLWRSNLADTSVSAGSAEHRVNQSMVAWLEGCSRGNGGLVLPAAQHLADVVALPS